MFDGKEPIIDKVQRIMSDLKTHIQGFTKQFFYMDLELAQRILQSFENSGS